MAETKGNGGPPVEPPPAESAGESLPDARTLQRRAGPIVDALLQAIADDLVNRAILSVRVEPGDGHVCDSAEVSARLRDAGGVFQYSIRNDSKPTGQLALVVADQGATALAQLALPEVGDRSPQLVAEALRDCGERGAAAISRLLRLRSEARLDANLPDADSLEDVVTYEPAGSPWLTRVVQLHTEGLESVSLQLFCGATTAEVLASGWRGAVLANDASALPLPCYLSDPRVFDSVARVGRRIGLRAEPHPAGEAPNPSSCNSGILVIDVPVGHEQRLAWCQRLKQRRDDLQVLMLLHHPSKARVLRACLAHADEILGWPADDDRLQDRLLALLQRQQQHQPQ